MRAALFQMNIVYEDKEQNYRKAFDAIREAAESKVDLFLMPEMSFTGFSMNTDVTGEEGDIEGCMAVHRMITYAQEFHMTIGFGWVKRDEKVLPGAERRMSENHYTIVNSTGLIISDYVKLHPFTYGGESRAFRKGDHLSMCRIGTFPVTSFVCYDLRFPEIFRTVCEETHLVILAANWPEARREHWMTLVRARAMENQCYVLAVNAVGKIGRNDYSGDSMAVNPLGEILAVSNPKTAPVGAREGLFIYDLEDDVPLYREKFPVLKDRRTDFYRNIFIS